MKTRECCGTTYDCEHLNDCSVGGEAARAALPCEVTRDGWCATHSKPDGPVYCLAPEVFDQLRRSRFHERENYAHWTDAEARFVTLCADVRAVCEKFDAFDASNEDVRTGIDLVVSTLDAIATRYEEIPRCAP